MSGVVVWTYKNNKNSWNAYEPNVSCELERLFSSLGPQQNNIHLGSISPNLSSYEVSFQQMAQMNTSSGSIREIRRIVCGPTSALGQGVVWEFEGDQPSQWVVYDLDTMDTVEEGFANRNSSPFLDLQQARVPMPYIIDFSRMTQMRCETGRIRRIQRRPLGQNFTPAFGAAPSVMPSQIPASIGQTNWPSQQPTLKVQSTRSRNRHQPYSVNTSTTVTIANGTIHVSVAPTGLSSQVAQPGLQQHQPQLQPSQNPGPVTRSRVHQTLAAVSGFQFSGGQLQQSVPITPMNVVPQAHQQMSRNSSSSSLSSMSVSSSQGSESLPSVSKISITKSKKTKSKSGSEALDKYMRSIHTDLDKNDCSICCDKLSEASSYGEDNTEAHAAVELNRCGHQFHKLCLLEMYNSIHKDESLQCPSCKTIYGEKTGNCPPGYMQWRLVQDLPLPGYEAYGTILVSYHISPGTQGPEHPSPGHAYSARGFPRQGYIPDCDKGRKVLKLLMEAFRRRLMFTIATSSTTGEANTVTWNEIHHKTEPHSNTTGHGYPDPHYLDNVLMELAAHGVTEDCLR